eukprot:jgi/Chrpa1/10750/Chrysochromulina_OHIO_Genome00004945-RA
MASGTVGEHTLAIREDHAIDAELARGGAAVEYPLAHEWHLVRGWPNALHEDVRRALLGRHGAQRLSELGEVKIVAATLSLRFEYEALGLCDGRLHDGVDGGPAIGLEAVQLGETRAEQCGVGGG